MEMLQEDVDSEIEKLKLKKVELTNRLNITNDFDEKEELKQEIAKLQEQIEILEKFRGRL